MKPSAPPLSSAWIALLLVPGLPAIVRVWTGLSYGWAAVATGLSLAPLLLYARRLRRPAPEAWRAALLGLSVGLLGAWVLYNRSFLGTVAISGTPDAGHHARNLLEFLDVQPRVYGDSVLLYGFVAWFRALPHAGLYVGFTVAFYATVAALLAFIVEDAARFAATDLGPRGRLAALVGAAFLVSAAAYGVVLVQLHYYHAEGFYPQIYGLLVLLVVWTLDVRMEERPRKLFALAFGVLVFRHTYGLNLPDLLLALALVLAWDRAWRATWTRRVLRAGAVLVLIATAWRCVMLIAPYYLNWGPFVPYDLRALLVAELALVVLLAAAFVRGDEATRRRVRLPLVFAAINATFLLVAKQPERGPDYYYLKTYFQPFLLALLASVGVVLRPLAAALDRGRLAGSALVTAVLYAVAIAAGTYATRMWRDTFAARAWGAPPGSHLWPLVDMQAQVRIDRVLEAHRARFGGYLTSYYPTMNFMNAAMGYWNGGIAFYYGRAPDESPGHCVFWEGGPVSEHLEPDYPQLARVRALDATTDHECTSYAPRWAPSTRRTLCWRCK